MTNSPLHVFPSLDELSVAVADAFCRSAAEAISQRGTFRVALSGGSTPKRLYELLAKRELDWDHIEWYWGDERNVPHDHDESNFRMVSEALLDHFPSAQANAFSVPVDTNDPVRSADRYEAKLKDVFHGQAFPQWDLALLGMGDDAHTASLFPDTAAISENERWFVANYVPKFEAYRYTLTAPAINSARQRWFLIAGANKRDALARVWQSDPNRTEADQLVAAQVERYPSQLIQSPTWFVTQDAMPG
ncbi:6-phosphogluconolactonase [Neorhodopirellula pilleata]|uniref:6-phosphogluconolactonase n=1 Tax=Neorhodopirellula pilleata TaxID=2714738 RepID=A0A5C5ZIG1_9BACT|nr:6-phosphogluconolactonase [Neorhodopirellula pilleata]TWT87026.1 6-phosphogluconolactonase [Neorhodopirellula pilleata]